MSDHIKNMAAIANIRIIYNHAIDACINKDLPNDIRLAAGKLLAACCDNLTRLEPK